MKTKLKKLLTLIVILTCVHQASAQGTAFNYQGLLSANGAPANGIFDLTFTLYDSTNIPGNVIAGPVTNAGTVVSNGAFTVMLNFGGGVFTGSYCWMDISVSPAGSNTFTELSPRQPLASVPYAVFATTASNLSGAVPAGQLTGSVSNGQLANSFITVNAGPGLAGGGVAALGSSTTLSNTGILSVSGNPDITVSTVGGQVTLGDTAATANTPGAIVKRDGDGNFSAGTITLSGTLSMGNFEFNTGVGLDALGNGTTGENNTALGAFAFGNSTTGENNTALGAFALVESSTGNNNTAIGAYALVANTTGQNNTADGFQSLVENSTGSNNIAEGYLAGYNLTTGSSNIDIGNMGLAADNNTIRIGTSQSQAYIAGVMNGDGGGLTNLNASQLASGTISLAQLPGAVITNNGSNVVLDGTFTEQGTSILTNAASDVTLSGTFSGAFNGGGTGTNVITNLTIIGTNTPIWSDNGNIYGPGWFNIYTGSGSGGINGIGIFGDYRNGVDGERYAAIFGNEGSLLMTGPLYLNADESGTLGIPDFKELVLGVADDVIHGIVQEHSDGQAWVYQVFSAASGGMPTNSFYTNGMETLQILADGQLTLLQPWQFEDGPHVNLLFTEAQPALGSGIGAGTAKTNTFGIEVYNGILSIGPVTGKGVNTNGTNWIGTNAFMTNAVTMDTNGVLTTGPIAAASISGDGAALVNLSANAIVGGLTTDIVVRVPSGGSKTLYFTNGILMNVQ
jgi:hypothetical protein